jgi:hypothetical protein
MSEELSKNDLYILMESYKNNIQLNTTLLEQQKQMMSLNNLSIEKQQRLCDSVDDLIEKLAYCSKIIAENHVKLSDDLSSTSNKITTQINNVSMTLEKCNSSVVNQFTEKCGKLSKEHSSLSIKMYIAFAGMIGIIISGINLSIAFAEKYHAISDMLIKHIGR